MHVRFTQLVFGLRPSPAILGAVLSHHIKYYCSDEPSLADQLNRSFSVNDIDNRSPRFTNSFEILSPIQTGYGCRDEFMQVELEFVRATEEIE